MRILYMKQKDNIELWIELFDYLYINNRPLYDKVKDNMFDLKKVEDYEK
jgi:hypothetical protein